jgi:hypothetical protein
VVVDNHVFPEDGTAYENPKLWVESWKKLAAAISKARRVRACMPLLARGPHTSWARACGRMRRRPAARAQAHPTSRPSTPPSPQDPVSRGSVLYDLVNEPDNKGIFWQARDGRPSLARLYLDAMDAIDAAQPDAVYVLEGTGQIAYAVPSGDGFVTDPAVVHQFAGKKFCTTRYCTTGVRGPGAPGPARVVPLPTSPFPLPPASLPLSRARLRAPTQQQAHAPEQRNLAGKQQPHKPRAPAPAGAGIEDPSFFFRQLLAKPYAQRVVFGPHFYAQSVIPFYMDKDFMQAGGRAAAPRTTKRCATPPGRSWPARRGPARWPGWQPVARAWRRASHPLIPPLALPPSPPHAAPGPVQAHV